MFTVCMHSYIYVHTCLILRIIILFYSNLLKIGSSIGKRTYIDLCTNKLSIQQLMNSVKTHNQTTQNGTYILTNVCTYKINVHMLVQKKNIYTNIHAYLPAYV